MIFEPKSWKADRARREREVNDLLTLLRANFSLPNPPEPLDHGAAVPKDDLAKYSQREFFEDRYAAPLLRYVTTGHTHRAIGRTISVFLVGLGGITTALGAASTTTDKTWVGVLVAVIGILVILLGAANEWFQPLARGTRHQRLHRGMRDLGWRCFDPQRPLNWEGFFAGVDALHAANPPVADPPPPKPTQEKEKS